MRASGLPLAYTWKLCKRVDGDAWQRPRPGLGAIGALLDFRSPARKESALAASRALHEMRPLQAGVLNVFRFDVTVNDSVVHDALLS